MKVILKDDIENLGGIGDTVKVAEGYARNYLFPRNLAVEATEGNLRQAGAEKDARGKKVARLKEDAEKLKGGLSTVELNFQRKAGEDEKLFGSVTSMDIEAALKEKGYAIDKKNILLGEPIKALGILMVPVRLYPGVKAEIKVNVTKE
ncbi:MAG: 50S ribosomal protein L9 [Deltaproteobacteria bacterium]|nr:50S ribosomal protein L9 [Deltaproteobacteria bacterium]